LKLTIAYHQYSASDRCDLDEYEPLLFLGPEIIPLVVYELTKPENFFATALCTTPNPPPSHIHYLPPNQP
jgi:hypothetical protein